VALSLSIGLYSSTAAGAKERKRILNNLLNNNGNNHDDDNSSSSNNNNNNNNSMEGENKSDSGGGGGSSSSVATTDYYYVENEAARISGAKSAKVANRLAKSGLGLASSSTDLASKKPVSYGPEQTMTNLKYRFGPNYSIVRRVLSEVQSLLGGHGGGDGSGTTSISTTHFQPRRVLDFGSGVGSSGAAALDVFGVGRSSSNSGGSNSLDVGGIDWIHSIDASQCMRETTEKVLRSILEGSPWIDEKSSSTGNLNRLEEEEALLLAEYERLLFNDDSDSTNRERKRMERRRKRMERWDQSWEGRTDARTRLTFGESIVDSSSIVSSSSRPIGSDSRGAYGSDSETDDVSTNRRRLPWQDKLDEQRRRVTEQKYNNQQDQQKNKGSFDLILCSYTLTELPSVPASLAAATLLWEKLAPNGVLVIVEPGTPDGFGMLRSVRSMLLECCPPPEVRKKRKRMKVKPTTSIDEKASTGTDILNGLTEEDNDEDDDTWPEECHVIAPCTHNGTCPMSRHQKNHIKRNTRFSRYESAEPKDQDSDDDVRDDAGKMDRDDDDEEMSFQELLDEWDNMPERQKDELKMMLGGGDDMSDEEAKAMLEYMESMDSDEEEDEDGEDDDSDSDHDSDSLETDDVGNEQDYYNIDEGSSYINEPSSNKETKPSTMAKTDVFGSSFCSFVHTFPGGTTRRKGEKFAYLVVQKRVPVLDESFNSNSNDNNHCTTTVPTTENHETLNEVDIVDMLSKSVHHAQKLKKEELTYRLRQRCSGGTNDDDRNIELHDSPTYIYHMKQSNTLLQRAVDVEDKFLESTIDKLGLELLHGDNRRKSWGRLIRAPLKKKGHVLVDYCSAGCGGGSCSISTTDDDDNGGTQGRITRQKISRGWSARAAPGCYSAARKARWGGLWPDMSERVKRLDKEEDESKKMIKSQSM
jgi:ribosomal protein RSM22 (predicted rRNA methylase)